MGISLTEERTLRQEARRLAKHDWCLPQVGTILNILAFRLVDMISAASMLGTWILLSRPLGKPAEGERCTTFFLLKILCDAAVMD
jgi:hypothetical protein